MSVEQPPASDWDAKRVNRETGLTLEQLEYVERLPGRPRVRDRICLDATIVARRVCSRTVRFLDLSGELGLETRRFLACACMSAKSPHFPSLARRPIIGV